MTCVMYWSSCKKCKWEDYDRHSIGKCPECGSDDVYILKEFDEEDEHPKAGRPRTIRMGRDYEYDDDDD